MIEAKANGLKVPVCMIHRRVGCPFRELRKGTVFIVGHVVGLDLRNMLYNIIAYRLWWNHPDGLQAFMKELGVTHLVPGASSRRDLFGAANRSRCGSGTAVSNRGVYNPCSCVEAHWFDRFH